MCARRATGMHFATTTLQSATCGLAQDVLAAAYLAIESVRHLDSIWLEYARKAVRVWAYVEVMRL